MCDVHHFTRRNKPETKGKQKSFHRIRNNLNAILKRFVLCGDDHEEFDVVCRSLATCYDFVPLLCSSTLLTNKPSHKLLDFQNSQCATRKHFQSQKKTIVPMSIRLQRKVLAIETALKWKFNCS